MTPKRREQLRASGRRYYARHKTRIRAKTNGKYPASRRRKREFLTRWKLAAGCIDCGYAEHPAALDFDHVSGTKHFGIGGAGPTRAWHTMLGEIEKCVVRCANCHRIRTQTPLDKEDQ